MTRASSRLPVRVLVASALALCLSGVAAPPSQAADSTSITRDPAGDAVAFTDAGVVPAPEESRVDVLKLRLQLTRWKVVVIGTAAEVTDEVTPELRVRTGGRDLLFRGREDGRVTRVEGRSRRVCDSGQLIFDDGAGGEFQTGRYRMRVPVACFGDPARGRFGFGLSLTGADGSRTVDDALRDGPASPSGLRTSVVLVAP